MLYVIVPVYNAQQYLEEAVLSVLGQPYPDIRLVLVNDGSGDHSGVICDMLAKKHAQITVIHQKNQGASAARNAGICYVLQNQPHSDDNYIAFLDADDLWCGGVVTSEIMDAILHAKWDIAGFSCRYCNQNASATAEHHTYTDHELQFHTAGTTDWLLCGTFCAHFYKVSLLKGNGLHFDPCVSYNEDVIFMRQAVFCAKSIKFFNECLHLYRTNPNSVTHRAVFTPDNAAKLATAWYNVRLWATSTAAPTDRTAIWEQNCKSISASRLLEIARLLSEEGYSQKKIDACIRAVPSYEYIDQLTTEEMAAWQAPDLTLFRQSFKRFCSYHHRKGLAKRFARSLLKVPFIRKLRADTQFRTPSNYIKPSLPITESVVNK